MAVDRKGKILKVKLGYNANSSSVAALVSILLWGASACAVVLGVIAAVMPGKKFGRKKLGDKDGKDKENKV